MNEKEIDQETDWNEHLGDINVPAHWFYIFGVLGGGGLIMLVIIAILGAGAA